MASGFSFGSTSNPAASGGFSLGTAQSAPAGTTGFALGQPQAAAAGGLSFGATPAKTTGLGFGGGFGTPATSAPTLGGTGGLSFGTPAAAATTTAAAPAAGGFSFGGLGAGTTAAATTTPSTGFTLNVPPPTTAATGGLGGGFGGFGKPAAAVTGLSSGLGTTTASTGLGLFGATSAAASTATTASIFSTATTTTATLGLGGVDPKTSTASGGSTGTTLGKTSDGKAVKETQMPAQLVEHVTVFQKYVKEEKTVREDIVRMSTKPMLKVQEDTAALKQLLSVVSNGLQRNACAVDKLKKEMAVELKHAEMAQRTKDIPPGLQYENTAPTIYFQQLVEEFESRMITYRQQIETLENHLAALHQPTRQSPAEVIALMKKLHETFIALAAQLHQVNEAVKLQKEHYLNYRKIFHGDTKNIFEKHMKLPVSNTSIKPLDPAGPTPFSGMTNAAAAAMASVLNKSQQPSGAPPVIGLSSGPLGGASGGLGTLGGGGGLFGSSGLSSTSGNVSGAAGLQSGNLSSLLSTTLPAASNMSTIRPLGSLSTSIFPTPSAAATPAVGGFGFSSATSTPQPGVFGAVVPGQTPLAAGTAKPFQLQKPPQGAKRGKR